MPINSSSDAKKAILEYIEERLIEWADWFKKKEHLGVGYPPMSVEYRLMTEGHITREYLGHKPSPVHTAAEEIESLIRELSGQNLELAEVLRCHYLESGNIPFKSKRVGMSTAHYTVLLNTARWWLAARLTAKVQLRELVNYFQKIKLY